MHVGIMRLLPCGILLLFLTQNAGTQLMEPPSGQASRSLRQVTGGLILDGLPSSMDPFTLTLLDDQDSSTQASSDRDPAQQPPESDQGGADKNQRQPEPYSKDEFPRWARDLWRFTVIFVGSIPFTYFFTMEGYDFYKYAESGFSSDSTPWPFRGAAEIQYSSNEQFWIIFSALTASFLISTADFLIGRLSKPDGNR
jgi:hypothetical protein